MKHELLIKLLSASTVVGIGVGVGQATQPGGPTQSTQPTLNIEENPCYVPCPGCPIEPERRPTAPAPAPAPAPHFDNDVVD